MPWEIILKDQKYESLGPREEGDEQLTDVKNKINRQTRFGNI